MRPCRCAAALALLLGAAPALARSGGGDLHLLDAALTLGPAEGAALAGGADLEPRAGALVAMADPGGATTGGPAAGGLEFDLLGAAPPPSAAAEAEGKAAKTRRKLLSWHQGIGLALVATELGTTVAGQLNYQDKFAGTAPSNTDRYRATHKVLALTTFGLFAANGIIALLAPAPGRKLQLDRVMVHRISMAVATLGMIAQGVYGFRTAGREGYADQASLAKTHLVLGYATLAAFGVGVGVITF